MLHNCHSLSIPICASEKSAVGAEMGNAKSRGVTVPEAEMKLARENSRFTEIEITKLYEKFRIISGAMQKADTIELNEFMAALSIDSDALAKRIFNVFDCDGNQSIDFQEFVTGLSALYADGSAKEKLEFGFRIFDADNDGSISKAELLQILRSSLQQHHMIELTDSQMELLVNSTFDEVDLDGNGSIDFEEYCDMVTKHPNILQSLSLKPFHGQQ